MTVKIFELILIKHSRAKTVLDQKGCRVISGLWSDFYYDEQITQASRIDIDHIVPLKNAHISGADSWTREQRKAFANDPQNLVITNLRYNRQKGSKSPLGWLPLNKQYACRYIDRWIAIKRKYGLRISPQLIEQFDLMGCLV